MKKLILFGAIALLFVCATLVPIAYSYSWQDLGDRYALIASIGTDPVDYEPIVVQDTTTVDFNTGMVRFDRLKPGYNDGDQDYFVTTGSQGQLLRSPKSSLTISSSQITGLPAYITASSTNTLTNKSGNISQWTNNSGYITGVSGSDVTTALGYTPYNSTNPSSYITATGAVTLTNKAGNISQWTNNSGFITGIVSSDIITALGFTPYNATNPNGYTTNTGTVTSVGVSSTDFSISGSPVTTSGSITLNLNTSGVTASTYSGVTVNNKGIVTAATNRSFNNTPGRSVVTGTGATGFQVSSTRDAMVTYSVTISTAVQIGVATNVDGYVVIEIASTNSATPSDWVEIGRTSQAQNIGLALALSSTQKGGGSLMAMVPAGYYTKIRSVNTAGTPTYTYNSGQETQL